AMTVPYVIVANLLGPEFPSLTGGLVGLTVVGFAAKKGVVVTSVEEHSDFEPRERWETGWCLTISIQYSGGGRMMGMLQAWVPYLMVALFLVITRLKWLPVDGWLQAWEIRCPIFLARRSPPRYSHFIFSGPSLSSSLA